MQDEVSLDKTAIRDIIHQINDLWLNKKYDEIGKFLSQDVVIAPPGFKERITGRDAYVQSYREYDQSAQTQKFMPDEPQIDIIDETAIALCPFFIKYELNGETYQEYGRDIIVLSRSSGEWRIVWRAMQSENAQ